MNRRLKHLVRLRYAALVALAAAAEYGALARAEALPVRGTLDPRVRSASYDPGQVYRLPAFVGYQIDLQFEPGEKFVGLAAGDIEGLSFVAQDHHVFLKPKAAMVATNLTVLTDRRPYQFEYSAQIRRPDPARDEVIYALRFTYEATGVAVPGESAAAQVSQQLQGAAAERPHNTDYRYCGSRALKPTSVWDDGVQQHLTFAPGRDLPAPFTRAADGTESLVNFTVEADEVIVHRLQERLILRRGRLTGCLINRAFSGSGGALPGGTVSPQVLRRTREVLP